jgi:hypothetical protein
MRGDRQSFCQEFTPIHIAKTLTPQASIPYRLYKMVHFVGSHNAKKLFRTQVVGVATPDALLFPRTTIAHQKQK